MRRLYAGGGILAAAFLMVLGLVAVGGTSNTPRAQAQAACADEEAHCLVITKEAEDAEDDFSFESDDSGFMLGAGESEAINIDGTGPFTVTEEETEGWVLASISCAGDAEFAEADEDSASVTVDFEAWDEDGFATVTCTFVNEMEEEEATPTATATEEADETSTPDATTTADEDSTPSVVITAVPGGQSTPDTENNSVSGGSVRPPNTGSGGLKN